VKPLVSVVMPVYNNAEHLCEAMTSILRQTLRELELIVVDDASTDDTPRMVDSVRDERIRYLRNNRNLGVAGSLNRGLDEARGELIARMDGDDVSRPCRLERQAAFLRSRPGLGACGSWVRIFGSGRPFDYRYPTGEACVDASLLFANPLAHGSVMMRAAAVRDAGLRYDETVGAAQDFELWRRCRGRFGMDNVPEVLLDYRRHEGSVSARRKGQSRGRLLALLRTGLEELGISPDRDELLFHAEVGNGSGMPSRADVIAADRWLAKLGKANAERGVYDKGGFAEAASRVWFNICRNSAHLGPWVRRAWRGGSFTLKPAPREVLLFRLAAAAALFGRTGGFPQGRLDVTPGEIGS
jgi:glycosyltransferase involved in cell wall biosynthesis